MGGDWGPDGDWLDTELLADVQNVTIAPGGGHTVMFGIDVRGYQSLHLTALAEVTGAAAYCPVRVNLEYSNPIPQLGNPSGVFQVYREDYEFWAATASPGANQESISQGAATFYSADQVHGAFANYFLNNGGPSNINIIRATIHGTNQRLIRPFQQQSPYDDVMYENPAIAMPAGNIYYVIPLKQFYGRTQIHLADNGGGLIQMTFTLGSSLFNLYLMNGAGTNTGNFEFVFPRRPVLLRLNRPAGAGTARMYVITQRERA